VLQISSPAIAQTLTPPAETRQTTQERRATQGTFLTHLIEDTLVDFSRLPSEETVKLLGIGATVAALGHLADRPSSNMMSASPALEQVLQSGESLGGARMQLAGAAATYLVGRVIRNDRTAVIGADLLRAQFVTQALTAAVKMSARRERPDGTMYSFPSGHSSVSFATATVLHRHFGWKVGAPAYAFATYVAASRVQERRHFLSDVAFGAALGIAVGRTVTIGRGDAQFAVSPMAVPGGGGVSFNWIGGQKP
jgi:membrane-associated phospholipid phosphatase